MVFSPLEQEINASSLSLLEQILRNVRLNDFSIVPVAYATEWIYFSTPAPQNKTRGAKAGQG